MGLAHRAEVEINGENWTFHIGQPVKGQWTARGWRGEVFALYREGTTLKAMKAEAQAFADYAATQTCSDCKNIGGHRGDCVRLAGAGRLAEQLSGRMICIAPAVKAAAASLRQMADGFRKPLPCNCPTPTHRMSCGVDSTPKVVQL